MVLLTFCPFLLLPRHVQGTPWASEPPPPPPLRHAIAPQRIVLALPQQCARPVHRSRSGESVRNISVRLSAVRDAHVPDRQCAAWVDERSGAVKTCAHEFVSVLSDCHQRGNAHQTEQFIPTIQKEVLQAARSNTVLCKDCKGKEKYWKLHGRKYPGTCRVLGLHLGRNLRFLELCFLEKIL